MEKEREVNPATDVLLGMSVPGSDEETHEVIEAFKKVFNEKMKAEEDVRIGKIGRCLHVYEKPFRQHSCMVRHVSLSFTVSIILATYLAKCETMSSFRKRSRHLKNIRFRFSWSETA